MIETTTSSSQQHQQSSQCENPDATTTIEGVVASTTSEPSSEATVVIEELDSITDTGTIRRRRSNQDLALDSNQPQQEVSALASVQPRQAITSTPGQENKNQRLGPPPEDLDAIVAVEALSSEIHEDTVRRRRSAPFEDIPLTVIQLQQESSATHSVNQSNLTFGQYITENEEGRALTCGNITVAFMIITCLIIIIYTLSVIVYYITRNEI